MSHIKKLLLVIVAVAVAIGGGSFYGGMKYAENKNSRGQFSRAGFENPSLEERQRRLQELGANAGGARLRQGLGGQGGFVGGEIISKDEKSITVKLQDGGSRIIFLSDSTQVSKSTQGSLNDLAVGTQISANGSQNSDGSITAQTIQIRNNPRANNGRPQ